jgi:cytochrome b involved in lipid metabolism
LFDQHKKGAGKDASDMFDDVGHSGAAIEYLKDFYIGQLAKEE